MSLFAKAKCPPLSSKDMQRQTEYMKYAAAAGALIVVALNVAIASLKLASELKK